MKSDAVSPFVKADLDRRDKRIVRLFTEECMRAGAIGRLYGISGERVCQVLRERGALPPRGERLRQKQAQEAERAYRIKQASLDPDIIRYRQEKALRAKRPQRQRPEMEAAMRQYAASLEDARQQKKGGRPRKAGG